jgi:tetratricopeptide (TPR) repeat protein
LKEKSTAMRTLFLLLILLLLFSEGYTQTFERYKTLPDTVYASEHLGYTRRLSITVPIEYQQNSDTHSFPLLIIFDSQNNRSYNYHLQTIDYLTSTEQMPASVIIGVESSQETRYLETQMKESDERAFGAKNEAFIMQELLPFAQKHHQTSSFVGLIGHSRYAYFSTLLLTRQPEKLHAVIALSPFMQQKNCVLSDSLMKFVDGYKEARATYYSFSMGSDYPEDYALVEEKLSQRSLPKNLTISGTFFREADHNATPGLSIATALYNVFEYWNGIQNNYMTAPETTGTEEAQAAIRSHYGVPIALSLGTLNGKGWSYFNEQKYEKAITVWEELLEEYPSFSEGYLFIAEAQKELKQSYESTLAKFKTSLARSTFYTEDERTELLEELRNW